MNDSWSPYCPTIPIWSSFHFQYCFVLYVNHLVYNHVCFLYMPQTMHGQIPNLGRQQKMALSFFFFLSNPNRTACYFKNWTAGSPSFAFVWTWYSSAKNSNFCLPLRILLSRPCVWELDNTAMSACHIYLTQETAISSLDLHFMLPVFLH